MLSANNILMSLTTKIRAAVDGPADQKVDNLVAPEAMNDLVENS